MRPKRNPQGIPDRREPLVAPCSICTGEVDLRQICITWPNGRVAHIGCFNSGQRITGARAEARS